MVQFYTSGLLTSEQLLYRTTSAIFALLCVVWCTKVYSILPEPYLDEFFHVRQAEAYLKGRWDVWDPKITTPPGLYIISYLLISPFQYMKLPFIPQATHLRLTNLAAATLFLFREVRHNLTLRTDRPDGERVSSAAPPPESDSDLLSISSSSSSMAGLSHDVFNICLFPPLFFFYGLYYTDVISTLFVLCAHRLESDTGGGNSFLFVATGLISLFMRQTNIFWVSIFCGGLKVCRRLTIGRSGVEYPENASFFDVIQRSWQHHCIYNPLVREAWFEDYLMSALSILIASLSLLQTVISSLIPQLVLLSAFGGFVLWNRGVVLGDKENHVASIHLSQMLYIWPYLIFFSFPLLYPYILNIIIPRRIIPKFLRFDSTWHQFPRLVTLIPISVVMLLIVHYNTIVHPFSLADNRHYMFYVFRLLFRHPLIKYASVPVYIFCAWAAITALGGLPDEQISSRPSTGAKHRTGSTPNDQDDIARLGIVSGKNRVSFVLIWLLATSLSLIAAPLVEPRYFILPWLFWRMQVPISPRPRNSASEDRFPEPWGKIPSHLARLVFYSKHDRRLWLETAWFLAINWATGYIFLYWGFEWLQEPGKVQRFMW